MTGEFVIALHATVYLYHTGMWKTSEEIAENACTNAVSVRRVMTKLVKAGIVEKREGAKSGGYRISIGQDTELCAIAEAIGTKFADVTYRSGGIDKPCMIASGMSPYVDRLTGEMNGLCAAYLKGIRLSDAERELRKNYEQLKTERRTAEGRRAK